MINQPKRQYPEYILKKLRQALLDLDENDTSRDAELNELTPNDAMDGVLKWEGIIGYTSTITRWVKDIYGIDLEGGNTPCV